MELKKELFSVRVPFRPELVLRLVNLPAWNLDMEGGRGGEDEGVQFLSDVIRLFMSVHIVDPRQWSGRGTFPPQSTEDLWFCGGE